MAAAMGKEEENLTRSIYRATRSIKKKQNSIYTVLRSIYEDSIFVSEIAGIWPEIPLVANLRCGLWYSSRFESTCYFKSTDGHSNNYSFSTIRLNLHLAQLAGHRGGCITVDSTHKGKKFPDSMSKTIPIWACVLNQAIARQFGRSQSDNRSVNEMGLTIMSNMTAKNNLWDGSLHLPLWVLDTEKAAIEDRVEEWTDQLEAYGVFQWHGGGRDDGGSGRSHRRACRAAEAVVRLTSMVGWSPVAATGSKQGQTRRPSGSSLLLGLICKYGKKRKRKERNKKEK